MYLVGILPLMPWRLRHRLHYLVDSVHYFLRRIRAFQPYYPVSPSPSKPESPSPSFTFRPSAGSRPPTMPLADFLPPVPRPLDLGSDPTPVTRSPRVMHTHLHAHSRRIYTHAFRTGIGLRRYAPPYPARLPHMRFLFVGIALCLRLPSDSVSQRTPLAFG
jgi:hypothetical protein